jgi:alcohol dehydrogenase YqhD (iron-dependent ADH family)
MPLGERPIFKSWLEFTQDQLLDKYAEVMNNLWGMEQEHSLAVGEEAKARYNEYFNHDFGQTTHQYREMASKRASVTQFMVVSETAGNIKSLSYEKTFIEMVLRIKYNVDG